MSVFADLQRLDSGGSPLVELFELEIAPDQFIYFTNYAEEQGPIPSASIRFRDHDSPTVIREYAPIPAKLEGIEHKSEGQLPQPQFIVANVLRSGNSSLQGLLGSVSFDSLLGLRIIRRRTLKKYLYGEPLDANPPVELPRDVYYLDRIEEENSRSVTFTTVSPTDLTGVTLPRRVIIGNACAWKYQAAGLDKPLWERTGGCVWPENNTIEKAGLSFSLYVNQDDEYILNGNTFSPATYSGSAVRETIYKTVRGGLEKLQPEGSVARGVVISSTSSGNITVSHRFNTGDMVQYIANGASGGGLTNLTEYWVRRLSATSFSVHTTYAGALANTGRITVTTPSGGTPTISPAAYDYWQSTNGTVSTPADNSINWKRVRLFTPYSGSIPISVFTIDKYNTYVLDSGVLWKASRRSQSPGLHTIPGYGALWERGDRCGKRIVSCSMRFGVNPRLVLPYTARTGTFPVGSQVSGNLSSSRGTVLIDTGSSLVLNNVTGIFQVSELVSGSLGSATVTGVLNTTGIYPSTTIDDAIILPFGAFPTARAFE